MERLKDETYLLASKFRQSVFADSCYGCAVDSDLT